VFWLAVAAPAPGLLPRGDERLSESADNRWVVAVRALVLVNEVSWGFEYVEHWREVDRDTGAYEALARLAPGVCGQNFATGICSDCLLRECWRSR
jgi:hypothetical protein